MAVCTSTTRPESYQVCIFPSKIWQKVDRQPQVHPRFARSRISRCNFYRATMLEVIPFQRENRLLENSTCYLSLLTAIAEARTPEVHHPPLCRGKVPQFLSPRFQFACDARCTPRWSAQRTVTVLFDAGVPLGTFWTNDKVEDANKRLQLSVFLSAVLIRDKAMRLTLDSGLRASLREVDIVPSNRKEKKRCSSPLLLNWTILWQSLAVDRAYLPLPDWSLWSFKTATWRSVRWQSRCTSQSECSRTFRIKKRKINS